MKLVLKSTFFLRRTGSLGWPLPRIFQQRFAELCFYLNPLQSNSTESRLVISLTGKVEEILRKHYALRTAKFCLDSYMSLSTTTVSQWVTRNSMQKFPLQCSRVGSVSSCPPAWSCNSSHFRWGACLFAVLCCSNLCQGLLLWLLAETEKTHLCLGPLLTNVKAKDRVSLLSVAWEDAVIFNSS